MSSIAVYKIRGSATEPYVVTVTKAGNELRVSCTCAAGEKGQACKHRLGLLVGQPEDVVEGDPQAISGWLEGTSLHAAMLAVAELEAQAEEIKKKINAAKKQVGRLMG